MTTIGDGVGPSSAEARFPAFAKLQGKDFEYYMRKYSIIVGRNSRKTIVDLDLGNRDGGGLSISRRHARIYYDFNFRCFALEVLGRKGCLIRNVIFMPGSPPVRLDSQDLLQISEVRFYFLLPTRSFFETSEAAWKIVPPLLSQKVVPSASNDKKGEETERDRKETVGISHGEGHVSGSIVQEFNAREAGVSSSEQHGAVKAASQMVGPKPSQLMVAPLSPSTRERKVEDKGNEGMESLASGHGDCGVSGSLIFKEINAREAEGSSGVLSGPFDVARQSAPPSLPMVPLAYSNNVKMGDEREHDGEEVVRIDDGKGIVSGLIVEEFNASKAEGSSGIFSGASGAAKRTEPSLLPLLVAVPLAFINDVRKGEERLQDREESLGIGHGKGDVSGLMVKEFNSAEVEHSSGVSSVSLEAARKITLPPSAQLVVVPPTSSNNERKRKDREENLGIAHGKNAVSGLVVEEFNARDDGVLSNKQSGTLEAAKQMEPLLPSEPVVDLLTASVGEDEDGDREKRSGFGPGEGDASVLIVEELNAEEAGGFPSEQSGTCKTAKHIVSSLPPQPIAVPLSASNDERKGDGKESEGTGHSAVAVTGFIVQDLITKDAADLSGERFSMLEAASQITSLRLSQPIVAPLTTFNNEKNDAGKEGESDESAGVGHDVGDITGLIVRNFNAVEAEDPSGGLSGTFEAAKHGASPLPSPLVAIQHSYSNDEGKGEERDAGGEKSIGSSNGEVGVGGLIVEEFNARNTEGSSDMLSVGIKQFCLSGSKLECNSSAGEADSQEETPDLHVFKVNLHGINKEKIMLELEDAKIWIQISAEHATENMDKTDMWHCVNDNGNKFLRRYLMLPKSVKIDQIKAAMKDGMLTVTVPKGNVESPAQFGVKSIEISDEIAE